MRYNYLVLLNCVAVKGGYKTFKTEAAELKFEQEMYKKFARSENDLVQVLFRY